mgnify:CR=1 FL=1
MTDKIHQHSDSLLGKKTYREDKQSSSTTKLLDIRSLKSRLTDQLYKIKDIDHSMDNHSTMDSTSSYEMFYEDYIHVIIIYTAKFEHKALIYDKKYYREFKYYTTYYKRRDIWNIMQVSESFNDERIGDSLPLLTF